MKATLAPTAIPIIAPVANPFPPLFSLDNPRDSEVVVVVVPPVVPVVPPAVPPIVVPFPCVLFPGTCAPKVQKSV